MSPLLSKCTLMCVCVCVCVCVCFQETVVNLAGLLVNLWLTPLVAGRPVLVLSTPCSHCTHITLVSIPYSLVWSLFVVFTMLHLLANYRAVSVVCMETLNKNRSLHKSPHRAVLM